MLTGGVGVDELVAWQGTLEPMTVLAAEMVDTFQSLANTNQNWPAPGSQGSRELGWSSPDAAAGDEHPISAVMGTLSVGMLAAGEHLKATGLLVMQGMPSAPRTTTRACALGYAKAWWLSDTSIDVIQRVGRLYGQRLASNSARLVVATGLGNPGGVQAELITQRRVLAEQARRWGQTVPLLHNGLPGTIAGSTRNDVDLMALFDEKHGDFTYRSDSPFVHGDVDEITRATMRPDTNDPASHWYRATLSDHAFLIGRTTAAFLKAADGIIEFAGWTYPPELWNQRQRLGQMLVLLRGRAPEAQPG